MSTDFSKKKKNCSLSEQYGGMLIFQKNIFKKHCSLSEQCSGCCMAQQKKYVEPAFIFQRFKREF